MLLILRTIIPHRIIVLPIWKYFYTIHNTYLYVHMCQSFKLYCFKITYHTTLCHSFSNGLALQNNSSLRQSSYIILHNVSSVFTCTYMRTIFTYLGTGTGTGTVHLPILVWYIFFNHRFTSSVLTWTYVLTNFTYLCTGTGTGTCTVPYFFVHISTSSVLAYTYVRVGQRSKKTTTSENKKDNGILLNFEKQVVVSKRRR